MTDLSLKPLLVAALVAAVSLGAASCGRKGDLDPPTSLAPAASKTATAAAFSTDALAATLPSAREHGQK